MYADSDIQKKKKIQHYGGAKHTARQDSLYIWESVPMMREEEILIRGDRKKLGRELGRAHMNKRILKAIDWFLSFLI